MHHIKVPHVTKKTAGKGFELVHVGYFSAVFVEAHGLYAIMGGAMALLVVLNWFFHFISAE